MPYNSVVTRANAAGLIPAQFSNELLMGTTEQSAVLRMAKRLSDIPASVKTMPVLSALPTAYFVSGDTGTKQTTQMTWANRNITAEELAVICPIPQAVFDDMQASGFSYWDTAKPYITEALGVAIDNAVLVGTNIPASWTTDLGAAGLLALAVAAGHTVSLAACVDLYDALMAPAHVLALIENDGFIPTGHIAHTSVRGEMRNCRDLNGNPIFAPGQQVGQSFATGALDGSPILYPLNGAGVSATNLLFAGQWNQLVYAMRQDISYTVADQGVIQDGAGAIVYNLFQQDMIALRIVMRLGFAVANPINRMNQTAATRCPFSVLTA
jgi:HK97 family phage major capsid protein